jgi:hypothetical protein
MAGVSAVAAFNGSAPQDGEKRQQRVDVVVQRSGEEMEQRRAKMDELAAKGEFVRNVDVQNSPGAPVAINSAELRKVKAEDFAAAMGGVPGDRVAVRTFERHADLDPATEAKLKAEADAQHAEKVTIELSDAPQGGLVARALPGSDPNGDMYVLKLTLANVSDRTVGAYQFGSQTSNPAGNENKFMMFFNGELRPGDSTTLVLPVGPDFLTEASALSVNGAKYEDGTTWGDFKQFETGPATVFFKRKQGE